MQMSTKTACVFAILLLISLSAPLFAQTAQVTGRMTDPTSAVIPAAEVTVSNIETGDKRNTKSNDQGYYTVLFLEPGRYRVDVQAKGFTPVSQTNVTLRVEQVARLDFRLDVGSI